MPQGLGQPLALRRQNLRFPEPESIVSGQTVGFFDHHPMMTAATNSGDGSQCVFKGVHRQACFLLGAKPGCGWRRARAVRRLRSGKEASCFRGSEPRPS